MKEVYKSIKLGDMTAIYIRETDENIIGLVVLPSCLSDRFCADGRWHAEPIVSLKLVGDAHADGFSHGHSMKGSYGNNAFKFDKQEILENDGITTVITTHKRPTERGYLLTRHFLEYKKDALYFTSYSEIEVADSDDISVEMISSYNLTGFSCLEENLRQEDFILHRLQSKWSMEGKLESTSFLDLQLEPAWIPIGVNSVRFGEVGSMPVRRYFPWMVAEDTKYGYSIGIQLALNSSWQMEVYNKDDRTSFSGGIADREFGHWMKIIHNGEVFRTPPATITAACEDVDGISYRLTSAQEKNLENVPEIEKDLPIIFNEYCTTWGNPSEQNMLKLADALKGKGITYCVMDAGWHVKPGNDWSDIGDWIVNDGLFPNGLKYMADKVREAGMIPGIWYEMEVCGKDSDMFKTPERLLQRDGIPVTSCFRRFLDMRQPEITEFLDERLLKNLKDNGFGYLKVDYNDSIGIGCEGAESLGEGLRQNMQASRQYFRHLREELPDLVIENCSSGGHRLEPSMMELASMASFSDAHEWTAIPVVAANVTRAILPAQSQIWAVLRAKDDNKRLVYSLANTFLGRMCLSGDVYDLSSEQWEIVDKSIALYKEATPIIKKGRNYRFGEINKSFHHLKHNQTVVRRGENGDYLVVAHCFDENSGKIHITLPKYISKNDAKVDIFSSHELSVSLDKETGALSIDGLESMDAAVILIKK